MKYRYDLKGKMISGVSSRWIRAVSCFISIIMMLFVVSGCSGIIGTAKKTDAGNSVSLDGTGGEDSKIAVAREDALWSDAESLKAIIISDLHYTGNKKLDHLSVPGVGAAEEITDTIVKEVIAEHPDVFIMTGDNTNSGAADDVTALVSKMKEIKDSGIKLIITTGNHDFDRMDEEEYEQQYFSILEPDDRDKHSLSYTVVVKDVVFLAMDDKALHLGAQGEFSPETMQWLSDMLKKYEGHQIIFLSHHNVLYGAGGQGAASHVIHNEELPDMLRNGGVKLAVTGHMHSQYITEDQGLWEILSGMPFSGKHLMGNLAVGKDRMVYFAEPVDFDSYGSKVKTKLEKLEQESGDFMQDTFSQLLEGEGLTGQKKDNVMKLINRFFYYYEEGSLAEHAEELRKDPLYREMIKALKNHNYGLWMEEMVKSTKYSGRVLTIEER